jgi:hypothetical protein
MITGIRYLVMPTRLTAPQPAAAHSARRPKPTIPAEDDEEMSEREILRDSFLVRVADLTGVKLPLQLLKRGDVAFNDRLGA